MGTTLSGDNFFWMQDRALTSEFCEGLIEKFEKSPNKKPGVVGRNQYRPELKTGTDLKISGVPEFQEEDSVLFTCLFSNFQIYLSQLKNIPWSKEVVDSGYQIQRTCPGERYNWHNDFFAEPSLNRVRIVTFIWYLNNITEGGETEFINGISVQPRTGRLLFFPSDFTVVHRGKPPLKETKYIVTGWFHKSID